MIYANGQVPWVDESEASARVERIRSTLRERLAQHNVAPVNWNEDLSRPYLTNKPTHEGLRALTLWAAYLDRPDLPRPLDLPAKFEDDPAYSEAVALNYYEPDMATLEAHIFVPSDLQFITVMPGPLGNDRFVATTGGLAQTLMWINENSWKSDASR
ncbi:MAG: hypothetical protein ACJ8AS_00065, partial [Hyphomicrobiales bacterium]